MALKHADIWRAIDNLAEREGLSPSGLAKKAGLSPTAFNPSKRVSATRKRWPSTESIAQVLQVTNTGLDDFMALATPHAATRPVLPLASLADAARIGMFDEEGHPAGKGWDEMRFPVLADPHAYALEVGKDLKPVYQDGAIIVVSPVEKPRRGDRVVMYVRKEGIRIGELGRETSQKTELAGLAPDSATIGIPHAMIGWVHRIVWASQ